MGCKQMAEQNQNPDCINKCGTKKKMSLRNVDVDRDGRITADIFECPDCQAWVKLPRKETKEEEIDRLRKRLSDLER